MKKSKTEMRSDWASNNRIAIEKARTDNHTSCRGKCRNGATCNNQGSGGFGWWANALNLSNIDAEAQTYWSGSAPTPSTSINRGISQYIIDNAPKDLF